MSEKAGLRDTTSRPTVSVIMPTRDYARYLPEAIGSVQAQTLTSWECIVVDDGSEDPTPQLLAELASTDRRIRTLLQDGSGPSAARNAALRVARGAYVQFLDADDRLHPAKLAMQSAILDSNPTIGIVYGPTQYFTDAVEPTAHRFADPTVVSSTWQPQPPADALALLLAHNLFPIEAPLIRREVLESAGAFDPSLVRMEDWELWVRCALAGTWFAYAPATEPVALIRVHSASASHEESGMLAAEIDIRGQLDARLLELPAARQQNAGRLDDRRMELAILTALDGRVLDGLRQVVPLALRRHRLRWTLWAALLPLARVGIGRRALRRVRRRRQSAVRTPS